MEQRYLEFRWWFGYLISCSWLPGSVLVFIVIFRGRPVVEQLIDLGCIQYVHEETFASSTPWRCIQLLQTKNNSSSNGFRRNAGPEASMRFHRSISGRDIWTYESGKCIKRLAISIRNCVINCLFQGNKCYWCFVYDKLLFMFHEHHEHWMLTGSQDAMLLASIVTVREKKWCTLLIDSFYPGFEALSGKPTNIPSWLSLFD